MIALLNAICVGQSSWEDKNRAGEKAFQEGHLSDASRLFTEALKEAQSFGPNDLRLAPIYNNLALVAFVQNNFITSEILYQKALAAMETQAPDNPLVLPVLDNLTQLYVKQWAFGKAIRTSWHACRIRQKKFGPESLETAAGLNKLAILYLNNVRLLPESPSDKLPAADTTHVDFAAADVDSELRGLSTSLENGAAVNDATKLSIAQFLFERVLAVQEKAYGSENMRLVDVLQSLGEVLRAEGKNSAAKQADERSIAIIEKSFGPDDLKLIVPLEQLAELKIEDGDFQDAEKLYRRALQISERGAGATDPSLGGTLTRYAAILEQMGRSQEAKDLLDRAHSLAPFPKAKNVTGLEASVPYILRFEKTAYDRATGFQQNCVLVRADGRFRAEEQQQESEHAASVNLQGSPTSGMPDLTGAPQDTFPVRLTQTRASKVFEGSLDSEALQQLRAILSAQDIRDINGSYPPRGEGNGSHVEKISASILREDGVQNFAFADASSRQPYDNDLKPFYKWLNTAEKHKGGPIKGATANNCSPDAPNPAPMQFSTSELKTAPAAKTEIAANTSSIQPAQDVSQDKLATLRVQVNLVLVPVVVRDVQGRALGTLRQQDFRLLDDGKPQTITRFSVEQPAAALNATPKSNKETVSEGPSASPTAITDRSVLYLFDDVHLSTSDLNQLRSAADGHLSSLGPGVRAAIFTISGKPALDFTNDRTKLHEALFQVQPHQIASTAGNDCPHMDPYLADLIVNKHDQDALGAAASEALDCAFGDDPRFATAAESMAKTTAGQQLSSAEAQSRIIVGALQAALRRLATAPGQHVLVVISPGFVSPGSDRDISQLIDYALRSNIIVNTLDARGLYQIDSAGQRTTATLQYRSGSALANAEILTTLADGTGGTSFHNSNDFATGFSRVAGTPEYYYVLGFSPSDQELNGRFHNLIVKLNDGEKLTLQARKGYYARKQ